MQDACWVLAYMSAMETRPFSAPSTKGGCFPCHLVGRCSLSRPPCQYHSHDLEVVRVQWRRRRQLLRQGTPPLKGRRSLSRSCWQKARGTGKQRLPSWSALDYVVPQNPRGEEHEDFPLGVLPCVGRSERGGAKGKDRLSLWGLRSGKERRLTEVAYAHPTVAGARKLQNPHKGEDLPKRT